jgi:PmbA protein
MMEKLLEMAKKVSDQAEIYSQEHMNNAVSFQNAKLHEIESSFQSGLSLRIIKNGKLGFAYTRNLINRQELIDNALLSLKGGVEAGFTFPSTKGLPALDACDHSLEKLTSTQMAEEGQRVCEDLKAKTGAEIMLSNYNHMEKTRVLNTAGTDVTGENSYYILFAVAVFSGSGSGLYRTFKLKNYKGVPDTFIAGLADLFNPAKKDAQVKSGRMKVLFMPNSLHTLGWRVQSGFSARNIYEKTSPIASKRNQKIFSENLTIYDDPLDTAHPGAQAFDDEGVACRRHILVENGVLKDFYYDLNYAAKLNAQSTGHGYKTAMMGGDTLTLKPTPALIHMRIKPGNKSFVDLVKSIDRGIIVEGAMGAHSGNIPNGDYSIGVMPGLYVENGEIVGRVKDTMVAGNIYETLANVIDIGDTLSPAQGGAWIPPVLCDNVSVSSKG